VREGAPRQKVHELSEQRLANVHARPPEIPGKCAESVQIDTTQKTLEKPGKPGAYANLIDRLTGQQCFRVYNLLFSDLAQPLGQPAMAVVQFSEIIQMPANSRGQAHTDAIAG
jgi:hypothetical protein